MIALRWAALGVIIVGLVVAVLWVASVEPVLAARCVAGEVEACWVWKLVR